MDSTNWNGVSHLQALVRPQLLHEDEADEDLGVLDDAAGVTRRSRRRTVQANVAVEVGQRPEGDGDGVRIQVHFFIVL